tara:strand:- start:905 stop:1414 length:510 start_codon:yes stop_codon:yes gene_type:complete
VLTDISIPALEHICLYMRESDRVEVYALRPHDNWYRLTYEMHAHIKGNGRGIIAWHDGKPAGLGAFTELHPGCWEAWMIGTDDFKAVLFELIRWGRRTAREILETQLGNRCQCDSHETHHEAHKLLLAMGAEPEGPPMRGYGKDGSAYQRFVWLRDNDAILKPGFKRAL